MMPAMKNLQELVRKKVQTPEETAAIISASAIVRGVDRAKAQVIGILGRNRNFARVHVGLTDVGLGKSPTERKGYTITEISNSGGVDVVSGVEKVVAAWLQACHGTRYETGPEKPVVKAGTKALYLAVSYPTVPSKKVLL